MADEQTLARKLANVTQRLAAGLEKPAKIVNVAQDGTTTFKVIGTTNKVWVQLYGGEQNDTLEAYNINGVKAKANMPVVIREQNVGRGDWEVIALRATDADQLYGDAAPALSGTEDVGELSNFTLPARNYKPGRVRLASSSSLIVFVEPFWYIWQGDVKRWPGGALDMSSHLPSTSGYWGWAWIAVDPAPNALVVVTGTEYANYDLLTDSTLAEIDMSDLYPVDALRLQQGMTSLERPEYFYEGRAVIEGAANSNIPTMPKTISSSYAHIPSGRVGIVYHDVTVTGTLTVEGDLIVI